MATTISFTIDNVIRLSASVVAPDGTINTETIEGRVPLRVTWPAPSPEQATISRITVETLIAAVKGLKSSVVTIAADKKAWSDPHTFVGPDWTTIRDITHD